MATAYDKLSPVDSTAIARRHVAGLSRLSPRLAAVILIISALLVGLSWSLASPPAASPDDDHHLGSIWCAWGEEAASCRVVESPTSTSTRTVRIDGLFGVEESSGSSVCYLGDPTQSAACLPEGTSGLTRANNGGYPPGYYALMRLFVGDEVNRTVIVTRFVAFLLCLAVILASSMLLRRRERARVLLFVLATSVPLALYLAASNNPSGVAIASQAAVFLSSVALFRVSSARASLGVGLVVSFMVLISSLTRPDAVYFAGVAAALGAVVAWKPHRSAPWGRYLGLIPVGLSLLGSFVVLRTGGLPETAGKAVPPTGASVGSTTGEGTSGGVPGVLDNLVNLPDLYLGELSSRLGSWDVFPPTSAWIPRVIVLGIALAVALHSPSRRKIIAILVSFALLLLVPLLALTAGGLSVGSGVQPRYVVSLLLMFVAILVLNFPRDRPRLKPAQAVVVASLATIANAVTLHTTIRRYVTGTDVFGWDLDAGAEWWWGGLPVGPTFIWVLGSIAFGVLVFGLADMACHPRADATENVTAEDDNPDGVCTRTLRTGSASDQQTSGVTANDLSGRGSGDEGT